MLIFHVQNVHLHIIFIMKRDAFKNVLAMDIASVMQLHLIYHAIMSQTI